MTTYTVSIGTLSIKIRSENARSKGKSQEKEVSITIDWSTLRKAWKATKVYCVGLVRDLLIRYEKYQKEKEDELLANLPPHSIFCEKRCCQKSFNTYYTFLRRELVWSKNGHLK